MTSSYVTAPLHELSIGEAVFYNSPFATRRTRDTLHPWAADFRHGPDA
ncbi:hypothetical protein DA2_2362 [Desulfovibrio sp. A2]|nr:hypothetical protein DA2_2362 [Desulfovibrio sp. A2]